MSPDTIHATQASLVIQCETVGTVLLDHGFGTKTARIGHMAKSCVHVGGVPSLRVIPGTPTVSTVLVKLGC